MREIARECVGTREIVWEMKGWKKPKTFSLPGVIQGNTLNARAGARFQDISLVYSW